MFVYGSLHQIVDRVLKLLCVTPQIPGVFFFYGFCTSLLRQRNLSCDRIPLSQAPLSCMRPGLVVCAPRAMLPRAQSAVVACPSLVVRAPRALLPRAPALSWVTERFCHGRKSVSIVGDRASLSCMVEHLYCPRWPPLSLHNAACYCVCSCRDINELRRNMRSSYHD